MTSFTTRMMASLGISVPVGLLGLLSTISEVFGLTSWRPRKLNPLALKGEPANLFQEKRTRNENSLNTTICVCNSVDAKKIELFALKLPPPQSSARPPLQYKTNKQQSMCGY